jgi:thioredoxin reductase
VLGERFESDDEQRAALAEHGVEVIEDRVVELLGPRGALRGVRLASGQRTECTMGFFSNAHEPETTLARQLGCVIDDEGYVRIDEHQQTSVPGVFAAGDVNPRHAAGERRGRAGHDRGRVLRAVPACRERATRVS